MGGESERDCPLCGGRQADAVAGYAPAPWRLAACRACGFTYLRNPPPTAALVSDFAWEKTYQAEADRRTADIPLRKTLGGHFRRVMRGLAPKERDRMLAALPDGNVLDVGCGTGDRLPDRFTPFGVEISEGLWRVADAHMRARGGYCVHAPATEGVTAFPERHFGGVLLRSFLEHETDPRGLLDGVRRVLAPGGAVYLRVPNYGGVNRRLTGARWCGFRWPDHVNYFTLAHLKRMAAETGFRVALLKPLVLPFDDNINAVLHPA